MGRCSQFFIGYLIKDTPWITDIDSAHKYHINLVIRRMWFSNETIPKNLDSSYRSDPDFFGLF